MSHTPLSQRYRPFTWAQEITTATEAFIQQNRMAKYGSALRLMVPPYRLNPNAELNQGLVAKYICLPGMTGGQYWYDLCQKNKGTLTNMTSGYGWQGAMGRLGGWGTMRFDGSDDYVVATRTHSIPLTLACWVNTTSAAIYRLVSIPNDTLSQNYLTLNIISGKADARAAGFAIFSTANVNDGKWHFLCVTASGTVMCLYVDGLQVAVSGMAALTPHSSLYFGAFSPTLQFSQGYQDDISIYNRALSATEVAGLYNASKNQYRNEILCAYE